tara:strand:- start:179 stop:370 length:192 start_codon:yes stop_codon:yes gene_type:complete
MNVGDVKRKLIYPINFKKEKHHIKINVENIIFHNQYGKLVIRNEYYELLDFNNDYNITNNIIN